MFPRNQKPHFTRTSTRQQPKTERTKNKMLCLLIKRVCNTKLRNYFQDVKKYGQNNYTILYNAFQRIDRNFQFVKLMSWKKIVFFTTCKKRQLHFVRFLNIVGQRYRDWVKGVVWKKIRVYGNRRYQADKRSTQKFKHKMLGYVLQKIKKTKMGQSYIKIRIISLQKAIGTQKYKYGMQVLKLCTDKRKHYAWSRILSIGNGEQKDVQHELGELNKQMDFMRRQLVRKNKQIEDLKIQLKQKKAQNQSSAYISRGGLGVKRINSLQNSRRSLKSISSQNRRQSSQDNSQKRSQVGSSDNINNTSILSWLNGSFASIKSGKSSISRSINGLQCYCKYRDKYNKYKAQTTSLRNQIQIIKSQLQVTKDLNQHLQQQISNICFNGQQSPELQILRKQVKDLNREKQSLKQKIIRNQKYIANLKIEFKSKIQNLYRNLKKNSSTG